MGTSPFRRTAVYRRCLRCAGAPRRPLSGSVLSLASSIDMSPSATTGSSSSGKVVARSGLRMMPPFPPPPLSTVQRVFPSTAGRLAYQTAPSLTSRWLSLHPASSASRQLCVCPSYTPWRHLTFRSVSEQCARWCTAMRGVISSTPEALAPVWVIVSQSIIT